MEKSTTFVCFLLLSIAVEFTSSRSYGHGVKQCAFRSLNDGRDKGQIQACGFQKVYSSSALRITYEGVMRLMSCSGSCCKRWFITINGKECTSPAAIDTLIYAGGLNGLNLHRSGTLDGFCNNIPAGHVTVGLSVGNCNGYGDTGDAYTCWNSVCRFIIEEVPLMQ